MRSTTAASAGSISRSPVVTVPPLQRLDDAIAVAETAGGLAVLDSAAQSSVGLLGQVLQEQGVHRALEADVQVRDVAFGERDDVDAGEGEALEESGGVFLVAAEAVQRLGEDDIESTVQRIAHQRLETGAKQRRAGHRVVRVLLRDRPALPLGKRPADAQSDRRWTRRAGCPTSSARRWRLSCWRASMNLCGVARPLRLEQLARSLTGKRSDESAQSARHTARRSGCSRSCERAVDVVAAARADAVVVRP